MENITYLDQETSTKIDQYMIHQQGCPSDILMELAGQSCANCAFDLIQKQKDKKIVVVCGPGNNGGDGLVAARHLKTYGCKNVIVYLVKEIKGQLENHFKMANYSGCAIKYILDLRSENNDVDEAIVQFQCELASADLILDALFGYSFNGPTRHPYDHIISSLKTQQHKILSIDVPSGWNINDSTDSISESSSALYPTFNISMMLPKQCMINYTGTHYIGGNFLNQATIQKFNLKLGPGFEGSSTYYQLK